MSELILCIQAGSELPDQTSLFKKVDFFLNGSSTSRDRQQSHSLTVLSQHCTAGYGREGQV